MPWQVVKRRDHLRGTHWAVSNSETGDFAEAGFCERKADAEAIADELNRDPRMCPNCLGTPDEPAYSHCWTCGGYGDLALEQPEPT